jgi:hypothetical protein
MICYNKHPQVERYQLMDVFLIRYGVFYYTKSEIIKTIVIVLNPLTIVTPV